MKAYTLIAILLIMAGTSIGQDVRKESPPSEFIQVTSPSLLYSRIVVQTASEEIAGFFLGVNNDSLFLLKDGIRIAIWEYEMVGLRIDLERNMDSNNLISGALLGIHIGNLLFNQGHDGQPFAFLAEPENFILPSIFGIATVGWLAYSIFPGDNESIEMDFSGDIRDRQLKWQNFKELIEKEAWILPQLIHFSIQAGHIFTAAKSSIDEAGVNIYKRGGYGRDVTDFNLLRKLQISYSVEKDYELGAAVIWLSEPLLFGYEVNNFNYEQIVYSQKLESVGYFIVGIYKPFIEQLPQTLAWRTGLGLGLISVDYKEHFFKLNEVNDRSITTSGIVFFTEFDYMISSYSSFGIMADYVLMPGEKFSVPSHTVKLGNASIGFKLGLHF